MSENVWSAITVALTVLNMGGAAFAWWKANQSRAARTGAETAARRAEEELLAMQDQARALETLADQARGPELVATQAGPDVWRLTNRSDQPVTILDVLNAEEEGVRLSDLKGKTIPAGGSTTVVILRGWGGESSQVLSLQLEGRDAPVPVPCP